MNKFNDNEQPARHPLSSWFTKTFMNGQPTARPTIAALCCRRQLTCNLVASPKTLAELLALPAAYSVRPRSAACAKHLPRKDEGVS
jgi:hypothetical protein